VITWSEVLPLMMWQNNNPGKLATEKSGGKEIVADLVKTAT
jgi:hypothetical protein